MSIEFFETLPRTDSTGVPVDDLPRVPELPRSFVVRGKAAAPPKSKVTILQDEDALILNTLADAYPAAQNQTALADLTGIPQKRIGERLRWLEAKPRKYVQRPVGTKRKGHGITAAGLSVIGRTIPDAR
jgi:hypothetical protein